MLATRRQQVAVAESVSPFSSALQGDAAASRPPPAIMSSSFTAASASATAASASATAASASASDTSSSSAGVRQPPSFPSTSGPSQSRSRPKEFRTLPWMTCKQPIRAAHFI